VQTIAAYLAKAGAQQDIVQWAEPYGDDWARMWQDCPRGDWLLALAARLGVDRRDLVAAACKCARLALAYLPLREMRPDAALRAAETWSAGGEDLNVQLLQASVVNAAQQAVHPAIEMAANATLSALDAVDDPYTAATAAACAAQAAVLDAGDCAMMEALNFTQRRCAELVRETIHAEDIRTRVKSLSA